MRFKGKIKTLNQKRFGFITPNPGQDQKADVFFHQSALEGVSFEVLEVDDELTFDIEKGEKGLKATHVRLA